MFRASKISRPLIVTLAAGALVTFSAAALADIDADAAKTLARQNNCFKCHGIHKKKDAVAWADVAKKYRGKPEAEAKLIHHVTSGEKVKFDDGHVEDHKIIKARSQADIKNLIDWILSLQ